VSLPRLISPRENFRPEEISILFIYFNLTIFVKVLLFCLKCFYFVQRKERNCFLEKERKHKKIIL